MKAKEYNDVYGQTDLDYANEFNEFDIEQQVQAFNQAQLEEEFTRTSPKVALVDPSSGYRYDNGDIPGCKG